MQKLKILVATSNQGKLKEINRILGDTFCAVSMRDEGITDDDVVENGSTFAENAYIKAMAAHLKSGLPALADDSGLAVDALGGAPGINSARYCGRHGDDDANNALLLKNMEGNPNRAARFVCSICFVKQDGTAVYGYGEVLGHLLDAPHGSGGFGYDPLFYCDEIGKSFGIASPEEKNSVSHRARALSDLKSKL